MQFCVEPVKHQRFCYFLIITRAISGSDIFISGSVSVGFWQKATVSVFHGIGFSLQTVYRTTHNIH